jgi:lipopolysaccharide/colanic/teichoic acid biosynthesis glycosyltransferase
MDVTARSIRAEEREDFTIPEQLHRIRQQTDWAAALPAQASGTLWRVQQRLKRTMDIVIAAAGLVLLAPLFAAVAMLVKVLSPGPVFYRWQALGRRGQPFMTYKFRTMVIGADRLKPQYMTQNEMSGPVFKMRNDPRVTPLGRWLRRYSIDELPQLWSVLKGDMSLVGPRPPLAEEFVQFAPWQHAKLAVTPGMTCLWQVSGRSEIRDLDTWIRLDLRYIQTWNLWRDIEILARTVPAVLQARGAY